jgi:hypothetical protein
VRNSNVLRGPGRLARELLAVLPVLALAACSKLSQVGNLPQATVKAAAATVGQPYTTDSSGVMHTTVRAGADVVLTGVDSETMPDDTGVPVIAWTWSQMNPGAYPVDLIKRTNEASSFTAPQVTEETTLTFQLSVTNANGVSASAQAQVVVEPVRDADHFLTFINTQNEFAVTAVTSAVLSGSTQAAPSDTVGYTITVQKLVTYTDLQGTPHSRVPVGQPVTYAGGWSAQLGSGGPDCASALNPQIPIPIPALNLDDQLNDGSGHRLSDVMETSDIDRDPANSAIPAAFVEAQVQIASTSLPGGNAPEVCVVGSASPASATAIYSADALVAMSNGTTALYDTSASAHRYYATIDPNNAKTTLSDWLQANGFNPSATGYGADAQAIYTNNFDLGLGRDMYMKIGACDAGFSASPVSQFGAQSLPATTAQTLAQLIGHCDVAAVVVNYVGVQAAAENINPIVAVAMEYSAGPSGGARFVKFYVFGPDPRTGAMQRITSVDLDHRGQKPVPQACVVCHGGVPATPSQLAAANPSVYPPAVMGGVDGDLNSGFIPWDLGTLLFSDTDPGFSQKSEDAALKAQYTEANQLTALKLLNVGAYLTFTDPNRFALDRELVEGWYGGSGLPRAYCDSSSCGGPFVPAGWQPGGTANNPADSATLYANVYAHSCRMCHALQAPAPGVDPRTATGTDANGANVPAACSAAAVNSGAATADQVPMGCYWEFANARNLAQRVSAGIMPFARRTSDRLWVQPDGSTSAGATLQKHFAAQTPPLVIATPGTSIASFTMPSLSSQLSLAFEVTNDLMAAPTLDIGDAVMLNGTESAFPDQVAWSVKACTGTPASPGTCERSLPVAGAANVLGWFVPDDAVTYQLTLTLDGGQGAATAGPYFYQIPALQPTFVAPAPSLSVTTGATTTVPLSSLISGYGNGGAAQNTVLLQPGTGFTISPTACMTAPGCTVGTLPGNASPSFTLVGGLTPVASTSLVVTVKGLGSSPSETNSETLSNVVVTAAIEAPTSPIDLTAITANTTTATAINLYNAVTASNTFPNCQSVQVVNVAYTGTRVSSWSFDTTSQNLTYTPQPGFATADTSGALQGPISSQETFSYQLNCTLPDSNVVTSPNTGTFVVPVKARVTFAQLQAVWNSGPECASCHNVPGSAPLLGQATYATLTGSTTTSQICDSSGNNCWNPDSQQTVSILFVDRSSVVPPSPNLSSIPNSALLCWPQQNCAQSTKHSSPAGDPITGVSELTTIQEWLEDGANDF